MRLSKFVGGREYTATLGPHEGSNVPVGHLSVTGPAIVGAVEYLARSDTPADDQLSEAIDYTVENIVLPSLFDALAPFAAEGPPAGSDDRPGYSVERVPLALGALRRARALLPQVQPGGE